VSSIEPGTGRAQIVRVFELLGAVAASGGSALDRALAAYGSARRGPGVVLVLSDFLEPGSWQDGVESLLQRGFAPALVQIVAPEELEPPVTDTTLLFDVEDPTAAPLVVDERAITAYRVRLAEHTEALRTFCLARGLRWMRVESSAAFSQLVDQADRAGFWSTYS
jgi:hypothetical protein